MKTIQKTIILTDKQDEWIKAQIDEGYYTDDSDYIRDLIRREQKNSAETSAIRVALIEGENSGEPQPLDVSAFKERMRIVHG